MVIYCKIKQYYFHTECPVVKGCSKKEVTVHFTREDTFHRGHRLNSVITKLLFMMGYF